MWPVKFVFQPLHPDSSFEKIEKMVQPVIGLGLVAFLNEVRQSGTHASSSVFDCDVYNVKEALVASNTLRLR